MTKAKISTHKGTAEATFGPYHVSIYANDTSDISEDIIMDKVSMNNDLHRVKMYLKIVAI